MSKPEPKACCLTHALVLKFTEATTQWINRNDICLDCAAVLFANSTRLCNELLEAERIELQRLERIKRTLEAEIVQLENHSADAIKYSTPHEKLRVANEEQAIIARRKGQIH